MGLLRILYNKFKLDRNLNKSRTKILQLQQDKFRDLLNYTYENSEFYRNLYQKKGINKKDLQQIEIRELPVVNKEMIMSNFSKVVTDEEISRERIDNFLENNPEPTSLFENEYRVIHTSGSTGRIGYFLYNKKEWDFIKAVSLRMFDKFGLQPRRYAFIGASDGHYAGISLFLSPINQLEEFFYDDYLIININNPLSEYVEKLNQLKPHNLTGYPSAVKMLAEMQLKGKLKIFPETIICGGEPFLPQDRERIKKAWGIEPVNYYASSESLMIGVERKKDNCLYIFDDVNYVEIKEDRTLITNLYNYTQPLIRYELSDVLSQKEKNKKNDWPFTPVEKVLGRREEMIWFRNKNGDEEFLHPIVLVEFYVRGLKRFQIVQTGKESFIMKTVVGNSYSTVEVKKKIREKMSELLRQKNMSNVNFEVKEVKRIPPDRETGKFRLIKKENLGE